MGLTSHERKELILCIAAQSPLDLHPDAIAPSRKIYTRENPFRVVVCGFEAYAWLRKTVAVAGEVWGECRSPLSF
jgi:hypothetical protein